jgi:hypothetical protein
VKQIGLFNDVSQIPHLQQTIAECYAKITDIQSECEHPTTHLYREAKSDTGNWCRDDDRYWYKFECKLCGKRWGGGSVKLEFKEKSEWRKWFAWHPVKLDGETVWLEPILRRFDRQKYYDMDMYGMSCGADWEYAQVGTIKEYEASLDGVIWCKITHDGISCALMNGYEVRSKTI